MTRKRPEHLPPELMAKAAEYMLFPLSNLCPACSMGILATMLSNYVFHGIIPEQREEFLNDVIKYAKETLAEIERFDKGTTIQ